MNSKRLRAIAAGVAAAIGTMTFHPAVAQVTGQPAMPGEPCQTEPLAEWTPQEKWVWRKVCRGEIADFNEEQRYMYVWFGGDLDPNELEDWPESRVLTPQFLETILLHEPFRSAQTRRGVRIVGAWFKDPIDLRGGEIERKLWLDRSRLDKGGSLDDVRAGSLSLRGSVVGGQLTMQHAEIGSLYMGGGAKFQEVDLRGAKIVDQLDMNSSTFAGTLNMDHATVEGDLLMREGAKFQVVKLLGAKIAGQLDMDDSTFAGKLDMASATVAGHLYMRGAEFQAVILIAAKIGGQLSITGSTFLGTLDMNGATVERDLFMHGGAKFQEVSLLGAKIGEKIGDQLTMTGSTFDRTLNMNGTTVEGALLMAGVKFREEVILLAAKIAGQLDMSGSRFAGTLNMASVTVGGDLYMHKGANFQEVSLLGAKIGGQLSMNGSTFLGTLDMNGATVAGDLFMHEGTEFQKVILLGAKIGERIGDQLVMNGSTFAGTLDMNGTTVEGALLMAGAKFQDVDLHAAKIAGQLEMYDSTFAGKLNMRRATVGGNLYLDGADLTKELLGEWLSVGGNLNLSTAKVSGINLHGATIAGQLDMQGSTFAGTLNMASVTVGGNLFMRKDSMGKAAEFQAVDLRGAKIADQLDMSGSTFAGTLDMRSATVGGHLSLIEADLTEAPLWGRWLSVGGDLNLRPAAVKVISLRGASVVGELWLFEPGWGLGSSLDLRDAKVGRLVASVGQPSPVTTRLAGFIYDALGSTESQTSESYPAEEAADAVEQWLGNEEVHSPQAHEQFAAVLRQMGFPNRATQTLYEGKNHELWQELRRGHLPQAGGLFVLWAMIGYGYRVWYALVWIAVLVAVGWRIARKSGRKVPDTGEPLGFWYSLDRLLPIMVLRKHHYEIDLPPRSRVYFYFHMFMGYVLAMFLLAGLSGLVG